MNLSDLPLWTAFGLPALGISASEANHCCPYHCKSQGSLEPVLEPCRQIGSRWDSESGRLRAEGELFHEHDGLS
jgi:hypothetical protein